MTKIRKYLPFAVLIASVAVCASLELVLTLNRTPFAVRAIAVILFLLDFYLCAEFFSGIFHRPPRAVMRHLLSPEGIIDMLSTVPVFIVSLFTMLAATGLVTAENAAERSPAVLFYFTAVHPYARLLYLARIVRAGAAASVLAGNDMTRTAILRVTSLSGLVFIALSIVILVLAENFITPRMGLSSRETTTLITYDLSGQTFIDNPFLAGDFARKYGISLIYSRGHAVYEDAEVKTFIATHSLFEMHAVSGSGITVILSAKRYRIPLTVFLLSFIIVFGAVSASVSFAIARHLTRTLMPPLEAMRRGFTEPSFNRCVSTHGLPGEIAELVQAYNDSFLAYKYRDRFIGGSR